jgi:glycosidase
MGHFAALFSHFVPMQRLYEVNARWWLSDLAGDGQAKTLSDVPRSHFAKWQALGITHLWLMGVWKTGSIAREKALHEPGLHEGYDRALPGWTDADVGGSPYAIAEYEVSALLGGTAALEAFRKRLSDFGIKLILDFVPNHLGLDHRWIAEQPELFVSSSADSPGFFSIRTATGEKWLAHGRDPNFPPWTDTVQLDYRLAATHGAMREQLLKVAPLCDGVRCDMAMLLLPDIFQNTWKTYPATSLELAQADFWSAAIEMVKSVRPDFLFLAEAYWGTEARLVRLGFDFAYDKELYDRLVAGDAPGVARHLYSREPHLSAAAHFLENHDENRIASLLTQEAHQAAAFLILTLPGLPFLHDGQLTGATRKVPVQLLRRDHEPANPLIQTFYENLLAVIKSSFVGRGEFALIKPAKAWNENPTAENFVIGKWQMNAAAFDLAVVNLASHPSQCFVFRDDPVVTQKNWVIRDLLNPVTRIVQGNDFHTKGMYLDLPAHGMKLVRFEEVRKQS